jgi:hypothetical protein
MQLSSTYMYIHGRLGARCAPRGLWYVHVNIHRFATRNSAACARRTSWVKLDASLVAQKVANVEPAGVGAQLIVLQVVACKARVMV